MEEAGKQTMSGEVGNMVETGRVGELGVMFCIIYCSSIVSEALELRPQLLQRDTYEVVRLYDFGRVLLPSLVKLIVAMLAYPDLSTALVKNWRFILSIWALFATLYTLERPVWRNAITEFALVFTTPTTFSTSSLAILSVCSLPTLVLLLSSPRLPTATPL